MSPSDAPFLPAATLLPFFEPTAVAVVGASRERNKIGSEILHNLIATGFTGRVVPVHPTAQTVQGLQAAEMVQSLKGVRLLRGFRGAEPADEAAFRDVILRISALVGLCPQIQELDLNPLKVLPGGVSAVDVRVRVA